MHLKWTELASQDLNQIELYISEDNSPIVAIDVIINILNTVEKILSQSPLAGRQGRVKDTRELVIDGLPFVVIYREQLKTQTIEILRVLHDAQEWPKVD